MRLFTPAMPSDASFAVCGEIGYCTGDTTELKPTGAQHYSLRNRVITIFLIGIVRRSGSADPATCPGSMV
jgi:hypothetical protein